jgi:L-aspartate oxidase
MMEIEYHDVVIIGSGLAGVYAAMQIPGKFDVAIITKDTIEMSNSALAQGGIAVSLDKDDSTELHFRDTLNAGAGLCNEDSVWILVNEAISNIANLCKYGVEFDKNGPDEFALTREGAHCKNRIIHSRDTTGKQVCDKLISLLKAKSNVKIMERTFAVDLLTENRICKGLIIFDEDESRLKLIFTNMVICATGGFGQIYTNTTNHEIATGDGLCLAYRAGAELMDLEFIQFHPTVLYHPENKRFLISEAVRGEGAILRNTNGKRFMPEYHVLGELAPRDVVSRAIFEEMKRTNSSNVYLDITSRNKEYFLNRFPSIYKTCLGYGIDMAEDYIPVAPAEHYCMGGIKTDIYGRTSIQGLYACGEAACNGIHGANRLASNSLLEGLVFGRIVGQETNSYLPIKERKPIYIEGKNLLRQVNDELDYEKVRSDIKELITKYVGIARDKSGLQYAKSKISGLRSELINIKNTGVKAFELQNIILISSLVIESALEREESRGSHYRTDFAAVDDANWRRNIIKKRFMEI